MKLNYYADTNSLYIDLSERPSAESGAPRASPWKLLVRPRGGILSGRPRARPGPQSKGREITEGVVLDYDAEGDLVGIDIDSASQKVDLKKLTLNKLPAIIQTNPA